MPYLNWRNKTDVIQKIEPEERVPSRLSLSVTGELLQELIARLEETFLRSAGELRLDLPENWIVFWKLRELETRLLIAHPQKNEWVTTVAAEKIFAENLLAALSRLSSGGRLKLGEVGPVGAISNVEIEIVLI